LFVGRTDEGPDDQCRGLRRLCVAEPPTLHLLSPDRRPVSPESVFGFVLGVVVVRIPGTRRRGRCSLTAKRRPRSWWRSRRPPPYQWWPLLRARSRSSSRGWSRPKARVIGVNRLRVGAAAGLHISVPVATIPLVRILFRRCFGEEELHGLRHTDPRQHIVIQARRRLR
jgi:hypothetical protein